MALGNTANVLAGIPDSSGGLWVADKITDTESYPTASTVLTTGGFKPVGFISEDGVTESQERDVEKVKAWGGDTIRVLQNEHTKTFAFTFAEMGNVDVLKLVYGDDNVIEGADGAVEILHNSKTLPHKSFVIEVLDGDKKIRKFIPDGQIIETGELQLVHSGIMSMEVTIEAFPDADGNKVYESHSAVNSGGQTDPENP